MEINTSNLEAQLTQIVSGNSSTHISNNKQADIPSTSTQSNADLEAYQIAINEGNAVEFLSEKADAMNEFLMDIDVKISYKIEALEVGGYAVSIVDDSGKVIKTIPGEQFIETRSKIRDEIKGLIEDSKN